MSWSFSQYLTFKECPRKWYFAYRLARTSAAKDLLRREAFYLKQLKTIDAWRGIIVDEVISDKIIPSVSSGSTTSLAESIREARRRFDLQLSFARTRKWREPGVRKSGEADYTVLWELETEQDTREPLEKAWSEIEEALSNFYAMTELWDLFLPATHLVPQEQLRFRQYDNYITCKPDLLILYKDADPILVDWKVHRYGIKDYRQQLALYALALTRSTLPKKYPMELAGVSPTDVRLREVQLLTKHIYTYDLVESEINGIKSVIGTSSRQMDLTIADESDDFTYLDVATTEFAEKCQKCPFRSICQENSIWEKKIKCQESKQISFLC